ncbi:hypothetical protein D3C81_963400 [compost metagenome]
MNCRLRQITTIKRFDCQLVGFKAQSGKGRVKNATTINLCLIQAGAAVPYLYFLQRVGFTSNNHGFVVGITLFGNIACGVRNAQNVCSDCLFNSELPGLSTFRVVGVQSPDDDVVGGWR